MANPVSSAKNNRLVLLVVLPLASCLISSIVGIVLGQMGNLIYKLLGEAGNILAIPSFCGLFLVTFGLSFVSNKLLRKWLVK